MTEIAQALRDEGVAISTPRVEAIASQSDPMTFSELARRTKAVIDSTEGLVDPSRRTRRMKHGGVFYGCRSMHEPSCSHQHPSAKVNLSPPGFLHHNMTPYDPTPPCRRLNTSLDPLAHAGLSSKALAIRQVRHQPSITDPLKEPMAEPPSLSNPSKSRWIDKTIPSVGPNVKLGLGGGRKGLAGTFRRQDRRMDALLKSTAYANQQRTQQASIMSTVPVLATPYATQF